MHRFKSPRQVQRFLTVPVPINNLFRLRRHLLSARHYCVLRTQAFATWREEMDDQRIEMVQFHQSYSYEDFIRGYRPLPDKAGTFGLQDGIFFNILPTRERRSRPFIRLIVDEINRGHLSQIFGELLMLIEADKRGPEHVLPLVYHKLGGERPDAPASWDTLWRVRWRRRPFALISLY